MSTYHPFRTLLVGVFLTHALAAVSSAQSINGGPHPTIDVERAVRLEKQAEALFNQPGKYRKAARLLRQAARLRAEDDREALASLGVAGKLSYYAKDFRASRSTLVEQAERALRLGEVGIAADAFLDAAFAAKELKDGAAVLEYAANARWLGTSTLLSPLERERIARRVGEPPAVVAGRGSRI